MSGGPDSLALMLLTHAARPGGFEVASVDHGLRAESAAECNFVAGICDDLGIAHTILTVKVPAGNIQSQARAARYRALANWMDENGLSVLATAHHADDQSETILMRLNRGSGLSGLAGVRSVGKVPGSGHRLIRPLLGWRKADLAQLVADFGIEPLADPSNSDDRFDRVRIRKALAESDWIDAMSLAQSASNLADAKEALDWMVEREWEGQVERRDDTLLYVPQAPRAIRLAVLERAITEFGGVPRGGDVAKLLDTLERGGSGNLAGVLASVTKDGWRLRREPPRRH